MFHRWYRALVFNLVPSLRVPRASPLERVAGDYGILIGREAENLAFKDASSVQSVLFMARIDLETADLPSRGSIFERAKTKSLANPRRVSRAPKTNTAAYSVSWSVPRAARGREGENQREDRTREKATRKERRPRVAARGGEANPGIC